MMLASKSQLVDYARARPESTGMSPVVRYAAVAGESLAPLSPRDQAGNFSAPLRGACGLGPAPCALETGSCPSMPDTDQILATTPTAPPVTAPVSLVLPEHPIVPGTPMPPCRRQPSSAPILRTTANPQIVSEQLADRSSGTCWAARTASPGD